MNIDQKHFCFPQEHYHSQSISNTLPETTLCSDYFVFSDVQSNIQATHCVQSSSNSRRPPPGPTFRCVCQEHYPNSQIAGNGCRAATQTAATQAKEITLKLNGVTLRNKNNAGAVNTVGNQGIMSERVIDASA